MIFVAVGVNILCESNFNINLMNNGSSWNKDYNSNDVNHKSVKSKWTYIS